MGSSGGGGKKGQGQGQAASAPPTVAQPPVAQAPAQQQLNLEQQFVDAPWSEPGWQSNANPTAQGLQSQYLSPGNAASQSSESSNADLAQWLFGGSSEGG